MASANLAPAAALLSSVEDAAVGEAAMQLSPPSFPGRLELTWFVTLSNSLDSVGVSLWRFPPLAPYVAAFESVWLQDMRFNFILSPGINSFASLALFEGAPPSEVWANSAPIFHMFAGAQYGSTYLTWNLPSPFSMGRELKAPTLGNQAPWLGLSVTAGAFCWVRVTMVLQCSGIGVIPSLDLARFFREQPTDLPLGRSPPPLIGAQTGPVPVPPSASARRALSRSTASAARPPPVASRPAPSAPPAPTSDPEETGTDEETALAK